MKTAPCLAFNFYPIFIPLSHLIRRILDFGFQISDLLYRSALSLIIKLKEFLKSKIKILESKILRNKNGITLQRKNWKNLMIFTISASGYALSAAASSFSFAISSRFFVSSSIGWIVMPSQP
jgi:hypothetical protein